MNARGLGDPEKLKLICNVVKDNYIDVLIVTETWHTPPPMESKDFEFLMTQRDDVRAEGIMLIIRKKRCRQV